MNELQKGKENNGQRFILSPEQQAELEKFKKEAGETSTAVEAGTQKTGA